MKLLASIAIHALLAVLLISIRHADDEVGSQLQIELVDVAVAPAVPAVAPIDGGRAPSAPRQHTTRSARRAAPRPLERGGLDDVRSALRVEAVGDGNGGVPGSGNGKGSGLGSGNGIGSGRGLADLPAAPPPPPAPKISKARPARLVYPSRQTDVEEDQLFIADAIVDADGFVQGVVLVRGRGGPRDIEAGAAVWRFRYEPALDDDGRPVRSNVRQPFAVAW